MTGALRQPAALLGGLILGAVLLASVAGPLWGYDIIADVDPRRADLPPGAEHWLGTDHLGRDTLWRLITACRAFAGPGLLACLVAAVIGVPAGALAGYHGGLAESVIRYLFTVVASVPRFVLVLLALSIYGNELWILALAAGLAFVPAVGEAVFARIEALRSAEYVLANQAYGLPGWRILWVHLVWAACGRLIGRRLLTVFAWFLVLETTLSYIGGFGVQEPTPSWGNMLVFEWGRDGLVSVLAPAAAIWATIAATTWLGEALGEVGRD